MAVSASGNVLTFFEKTLPQSGSSTYRLEARGVNDIVPSVSNEVTL